MAIQDDIVTLSNSARVSARAEDGARTLAASLRAEIDAIWDGIMLIADQIAPETAHGPLIRTEDAPETAAADVIDTIG